MDIPTTDSTRGMLRRNLKLRPLLSLRLMPNTTMDITTMATSTVDIATSTGVSMAILANMATPTTDSTRGRLKLMLMLNTTTEHSSTVGMDTTTVVSMAILDTMATAAILCGNDCLARID